MKHKKLLTAIALISTIFAKNATASNHYDNRWYVSPTVSYLWLDDDRLTSRSGHGASLGLGKAINQNINLEVKGIYNRYQDHNSKNLANKYQWDTFGAAVEAQYYFSRGKVSPFLVASAGAMDSNIAGQNALGFVGDAGAGLAYKISKNLSVRSDVRYRFNDNFNKDITLGNRARYNDLSVNVGFVIPFGSKSYASAGHKCHKHADKIAQKSQKVTALNKALEGINFANNSAILDVKSKATLDVVANKMIEFADKGDIEIQGHTSSTGSNEYNMFLSNKRAQAVANYLKSKGVNNNITAKGYGEEMPIADNATKQGRLANRRVVINWK